MSGCFRRSHFFLVMDPLDEPFFFLLISIKYINKDFEEENERIDRILKSWFLSWKSSDQVVVFCGTKMWNVKNSKFVRFWRKRTTPCAIGVCYMLSYSRGSRFDSRLGLVAVDQSLENVVGFAIIKNVFDRKGGKLRLAWDFRGLTGALYAWFPWSERPPFHPSIQTWKTYFNHDLSLLFEGQCCNGL